MPELPEVEVTRRSLVQAITGARIEAVTLGKPLRWPLGCAPQTLVGQQVMGLRRRGKYLLADTSRGVLLVHLGMSGSLRFSQGLPAAGVHDHFDMLTSQGTLRLHDPRRFGAVLWTNDAARHPLLAHLGPEPLSDAFDGDYLFELSRGRKAPVKTFLMDQAVVVGVGNIYAAESLFRAGISPLRAAGKVSRERYGALADAVKAILAYAITRGGTTLRDFLSPDGAPGYFEQELSAYGRGGEPCPRCGRPMRQASIGQRATVWCGHCQR